MTNSIDVLAARVEALTARVARLETEQIWIRHTAVVLLGGIGLQIILLAVNIAIWRNAK